VGIEIICETSKWAPRVRSLTLHKCGVVVECDQAGSATDLLRVSSTRRITPGAGLRGACEIVAKIAFT
jgi:hypothetical protein